MKGHLIPVNPITPQEAFVHQLEDLILEGTLKPGEKLPPERELAVSLKVSRPVVHEGLTELAAKGLITMKPRHGSWINDYRKTGSLELLNALYRYNRGALEPHLDEGLEEMRSIILKASTDRLLKMAVEGKPEYENGLDILMKEFSSWKDMVKALPGELAEADFRFYFTLVYYSGNPVFPLLLNSAKDVYICLLTRFFEHPAYFSAVTDNKARLLEALSLKDNAMVGRALEKLGVYASYGQGYGE